MREKARRKKARSCKAVSAGPGEPCGIRRLLASAAAFSSTMPLTMRAMPLQRIMTWPRVFRSLRKLAAYVSLMCFSCLVLAKLSSHPQLSWWLVFVPLWAFHGIVSRGRFSVPAPAPPHDKNWSPCHAVVAVPLIIAFELLLCSYLHSREVFGRPVLSLKVVFIPLIGLEVLVLVDNFRMCRALMPADEESLTDEIIWETLPHFWISVSMVFFMAGTVFTVLKLTGDFDSLGWWDLFINFAIAECFTFLVCTKWTNPSIRSLPPRPPVNKGLDRSESVSSASSTSVAVEDEEIESGICSKEDVGGHLLKVPVILSQLLLCMKLEGTPPKARNIPVSVIFLPLMLVQAVAIVLLLLRVVERLVLLMHVGDESRSPFRVLAKVQEICGFLHHGSRLFGWWSIDETSKEEQVRLLSASSSGYCTFSGPSPDVVKKMARKDLAEEIWKLQAALGEQTQIAKHQQHEFDRLQNEKVLCRVCFERDIAVVLLPCKHRILCGLCSERCKHCPICRGYILDRMSVFDV